MPALAGLLVFILSSFLVKLFLTLGIAFTTYTIALPELIGFISTRIASLPPVAAETLGILRFDICVTMMISAYAARGITGFFIGKITPS